TENSGLDFVDPVGLLEYVPRLDSLGFQVHFHALGDRAVRNALNAVAAAREANGPGGKHHLAHLQVVHPDDIARFAQVGATANIQTLWAAHEDQMDELTIPFLGDRRASWQYPFGDLLRAGTSLAAGSDWPVSSADPMDAIHVAVNRIYPGAPEGKEPLYAEQALPLAVALAAYTAGTARVNGHDDTTGRLEAGMYADLAVLDRDPFAGPSATIADATVVATFVEGERVFTREG
ncbi:MAG TPA: amidohydrolase family protein, partial [Candidatus Nanopelagicales bacterium]|nr:amidohydrolase family protein [Candidatus Nanopelagicales bacterium]